MWYLREGKGRRVTDALSHTSGSFLREAELKHCRVAMLATAGAIAQDIFQFPGTVETFGTSKLTALHDAAVSKGTMGQMLFWIGFFEIFGAFAIVQVRPCPAPHSGTRRLTGLLQRHDDDDAMRLGPR